MNKKTTNKNIMPVDRIESRILYLRGEKVMLDFDLANLYEVPTGRLNEQVKRNKERFPEDFMFQLTKMEADILTSQNIIPSSRSQIATLNEKNSEDERNSRSQNATLKTRKGTNIKYMPYAFTEQGVAMLSSVLKSQRAIEVNIAIMRTFVGIRKFVSSYEGLARKIAELELKYDKKIIKIMEVIDSLLAEDKVKNKKEIGFKV